MLENVTDLHLEDSDDWHFKTKCTHCNEEAENVIYFNLVETAKIEGSRGDAHFIAKCKFCGRSGNIEYCKNTWKPYTANEQFQTVAAFECRNIEILDFVPSNNFKARGDQGDGETVFDDIDLSEDPDWAGFDEDADCAVGVYEFKSQIIRGKKK